jgi:hypothetical protein
MAGDGSPAPGAIPLWLTPPGDSDDLPEALARPKSRMGSPAPGGAGRMGGTFQGRRGKCRAA